MANASFNLVQSGWIPCRRDGQQVDLGLYDILCQSHEITAIETATPLETASLYRLLLAILQRIFDTTSDEAWMQLWQAGRWDAGVLKTYFDTWGQRFDLFDSQRPFYQAKDERVEQQSVVRLYPGMAAASFFNHAVEQNHLRLTPAEAARQLVTSQAYGLPGICHPQKKLFYNGAPYVVGLAFFLEGKNLFQTLALNLLRYDAYSPFQELAKTPEDCPTWEMDDPFLPKREQPLGYLDYLTWPNRRIWLVPDEDDKGLYVEQMTMAPGLALRGSFSDPMKHYRLDKKSGKKMMVLNENRVLWRDSSTLLQIQSEAHEPPRAMIQAKRMVNRYPRRMDKAEKFRLAAFGMVSDNAKVNLTRMEQFPVPLAYLERDDLVSVLERAIWEAEEVHKSLYAAEKTLAALFISPDMNRQTGRKPLDSDVKNVMQGWNIDQAYWGALALPFQQLIEDLPMMENTALHNWRQSITQAGWHALEQAERLTGGSAAGLKAAVNARGMFAGSLIKKGLMENGA